MSKLCAGMCVFMCSCVSACTQYIFLHRTTQLFTRTHSPKLPQYSGIYPSGLQPHWPHSGNTLIDYSLNEMDSLITEPLTEIPGHNINNR